MSFPGVGPRASKEEFMRALSLDPNNAVHEGYYREMREIAITVYRQLNADRTNLIEEKRNDNTVRPSYFWHHIRPDRRRDAILRTWYAAPPGSRPRLYFDAGATQNNDIGPNWVTHWLLYSVFRSRDERNNRNRRAGDDRNLGNGGGRGHYYDPARDQV